jgi:hypothetical protein
MAFRSLRRFLPATSYALLEDRATVKEAGNGLMRTGTPGPGKAIKNAVAFGGEGNNILAVIRRE